MHLKQGRLLHIPPPPILWFHFSGRTRFGLCWLGQTGALTGSTEVASVVRIQRKIQLEWVVLPPRIQTVIVYWIITNASAWCQTSEPANHKLSSKFHREHNLCTLAVSVSVGVSCSQAIQLATGRAGIPASTPAGIQPWTIYTLVG